MNAWWAVRILCQPDQMESGHVRAVITDLVALGYDAAKGEDGSIWCFAADGSGSLLFDSLNAAMSWLAPGEGLLTLRRGNLDVDVSVHRHAGILGTEMESLPDEPIFDVVAFTVSDKALRGPRRDSVWTSLQEAISAALRALPFSFAYGLSEAATEAVAEYACVHRRVASNRLPPFLPWLCAAPEGSELSFLISEAASLVGRPIQARRGIRFLTLTDEPWDRADDAVAEASSRWRAATDDGGCW